MSRRRKWTIATLVLLFIMLVVYIEAGYSVRFEGWAYREATERMSPGFTRAIKIITHFGDAYVVISICLLLFVFTGTRKNFALPTAITMISSSLLNFLLKNIFARERPDILRLINETSYSFPSGHSMNNAALYTILTLLVFTYIKNKPMKYGLSVFFVFMTLIIGYSRIYLGVHYAGDVLGGWLLGILVAVSVFHFWDARTRRKADK